MAELQPSWETRVNRFPKIFAQAKKWKPNPKRVLSFGCSSGEECQTLAELYPNAEIVGIDIKHYLLTTARMKNKHPDRVFFHDEIGGLGNFDLAFALMVLFCIRDPIKLEDFQATVRKIDRHIAPDGLLAIYTAEHDPMSVSEISTNYRRIRGWKHTHNLNKREYHDGYFRKKGPPVSAASGWRQWFVGRRP